MLIGIRCKCGRRLRVLDDQIGKAGCCPACNTRLHMVAPGYTPGRDRFDYILVILSGPFRAGEVILFAGYGPLEIGKSPESHIPLAGQSVSRKHCQLVRVNDQWRMEDEHSTNGVYVNGERAQSSELQNGDVIQIGEYKLQFGIFPEARKPAPPVPAQSPKPSASQRAKPELIEIERTFLDGLTELEDPAMGDIPEVFDGYELHRLSDGDVLPMPDDAEPTMIIPALARTGGPRCPACHRPHPPKANICVTCSIDLKTGRAIVTAQGGDLNAIYVRAENIVRWLSWFVWCGVYPVVSESFGVRKPYLTRALAAFTILTSLWFWQYDWSDSPRMVSMKNYMLWVGKAEPEPQEVLRFYQSTSYGDSSAYESKYRDLELRLVARRATLDSRIRASKSDPPEVLQQLVRDQNKLQQEEKNLPILAHNALAPDQQYQGRYSPVQLISHAFLHGGVLHLLGNLLFLMVIGSRINAMVGNLTMLIAYLIFAMVSAVIFMTTQQASTPHPMVGASGAIMGLCGMYLVLMPMHLVHMAAWWRMPLWTGFRLTFTMWSMRGFWVVLLYIAFDVLALAAGQQHNVAHWAHLGGFITGIAIGMTLLVTRLVNCRGGDILSGLLGRHAWALIGKPNPARKAPLEYWW